MSSSRRFVPTTLLAVAVITAAAPPLSAQQDARPTFGRVVDVDGEPLAGAVVTLVGGHPHLAPSLQDVHVVDVEADRRGRVVARLRPGLCYVAWARADAEHGAVLRAAERGFFAAGAMFELTCKTAVGSDSCRLTGDDAWRHVGPLRYFAMTAIPGTERELQRGDDGSFVLPGPPFDAFEVRLPDGQPLWHVPAAAELLLPPPQQLAVEVVDGAGQPLVGAAIEHRVGRLSSWSLDGLRSVGQDRTRVLGVTDGDGLCTVEVPYVGDPLQKPRKNLLLFARADGRPAVAGGVWNRHLYVSDHKVPRIDGDRLRFEVPDVEPLRGVFAQAPAGSVAHLAAVCKLHLQRNSYMHDARVFTATVSDDGSFTFDDVPDELHSSRLSLVPPPGSDWRAPIFASEAGRDLPHEVRRIADVSPPPVTLSSLEVAVLDPTGGPARGAVAFVSSGERNGVLMRDSLQRVALDERGATSLRLVPGRWVVVVVTDQGFCGREVELGDVDEQVEVKLTPIASMAVMLRDRNGMPVADASVRSRGTRTRGTKDPVHSILQGLQRATRVQWHRLRTGADGTVEIPFLPVPGVEQRVELRWTGGRSDEFVLEPGGGVTVRQAATDGKR